jgi:type II secretory pathway component PulF
MSKKIKLSIHDIEMVAVLLESDISLLEAFQYIRHRRIGSHGNSTIIRVGKDVSILDRLIWKLSSGADCVEVFSETTLVANPLYMHLIRSSQSTGRIPVGLRDIVQHMKEVQIQRQSLIQMLIYPILVVGVVILMCIAMLVFVVPQLKPVLQAAGSEVPKITWYLVAASTFLKTKTWSS